MLVRIFVYLPAMALAMGVTLLALTGIASAHEQRTVGNFAVEVGFFTEPALQNQINGAFIHVRFFEGGVPAAGEGEEVEGGEPVEGLDESLKVEVIVGGAAEQKTLDFAAIEGEPGSYVAKFVPTVAGDYTFHITGDINGTAFDETFESGPGRFDSVALLEDFAFPATTASDGAAIGKSVQELQAKVDKLDSGGSDGTARTLGTAGLVAGLVALGLGGFAVMKQRG